MTTRRDFLRMLGVGAATTAAGLVVPELIAEPARRFWQVGRNAPVGQHFTRFIRLGPVGSDITFNPAADDWAADLVGQYLVYESTPTTRWVAQMQRYQTWAEPDWIRKQGGGWEAGAGMHALPVVPTWHEAVDVAAEACRRRKRNEQEPT